MQDAQLELTITNKNELYNYYMPYIKNGGLFVPTKMNFYLGGIVSAMVKLYCLTEPVMVTGKVVWITPLHAQGGRPAGVGIQFTQDNTKHIKDVIEKQLAGLLQSNQPNSTI